MCNGMSAPQTINACNGNDCADSYAPSHAALYPGQPLMWTENEGWFEQWNSPSDQPSFDDRTPADMANSIAAWIAAGASHHNYYMYVGLQSDHVCTMTILLSQVQRGEPCWHVRRQRDY